MYVKYPVDKVEITSNFGMRLHPITKVSRYHYGLDLGLAGKTSQSLYATHDATVVEEGYNSSMGNYIVLKYDKNSKTIINIYMHMKQRALVKKGKKVKQYQKLGYMGETGLAQGVHLHIEYWVCPKDYKYNSADAPKYAKNPLDYLYLFDDQRATQASLKVVQKVVGTPTEKNTNKNQIEVIKEKLNCRTSPTTKATILGYINLGYYDIIEEKKQPDDTWYKIDYNKWIAGVSTAVKVYKIKEKEQEEPKNEEQPKEETNQIEINEENYQSFTAPKTDTYYIKLNQNETIYFPKQKELDQ